MGCYSIMRPVFLDWANDTAPSMLTCFYTTVCQQGIPLLKGVFYVYCGFCLEMPLSVGQLHFMISSRKTRGFCTVQGPCCPI
jgi:hypothetical protein